MPELPEVEAVCRRMRRDAVGQTIASTKVLRPTITRPQRPSVLEKAVVHQTITAVRRRGKNILIDLSGGQTIHIHLRMTGDLHVIPDSRFRSAAARVVFELESGRVLVYTDPRALGKIWLGEQRIDEVGLEPLDPSFTAEAFEEIATHSRQPAKVFLLDQRHVAGIGNIYAAEILHRARIDPRKPMNGLSRKRRALLHSAIVDVIEEAVASSEHAYKAPSVHHASEEFVCLVYGRAGEPCGQCGRLVRRIVQGGRSTYFCPRCQR